MREQAPNELAEGIITALRTSGSSEAAPKAAVIGPQLGVLRSPRPLVARSLAFVRDCLGRSRLRLTVPIAFVVGAILSLVNQGGMLLTGQIDLRMCAICGLDFLLPFVALNILLVAAANLARDGT